MKAMCIDDVWYEKGVIVNGPAYGEIVTVTSSLNIRGYAYYTLAEYSSEHYFEAAAFVPLSDVEEKNINYERKTEFA